jgi:hypothetical protein
MLLADLNPPEHIQNEHDESRGKDDEDNHVEEGPNE